VADAHVRRATRGRELTQRRANGLALFALFTAIAALSFGSHYFDDLARGAHGTALERLLEETTGAYTVLALLPLVAWLCRRFPWRAAAWSRVTGIYALGAAGFSLLHTTLMALTRAVLFPALGLGAYDYGNMVWRFPMEGLKDVLTFAVIAGCTSFLDHRRHAEQLRTELVEAKLANLQLQLQPHFLFNTLNTISAVMYEDPRVADRMIARLADLLRVTLSACEQPETALGDELRIARLYLEIMQARLEDALRVEYRIEPGAVDALVPTMILQPLIENALRHGGASGASALAITIGARRDGERMQLTVADDGPGLAAVSARAGGGIGLANTRGRLEQLYGARGALRLGEREGGGAEVVLTLPYHAAPIAAGVS